MNHIVKDAPFLGIAVPATDDPLNRAYWTTAATVADIATSFGFRSARAVTSAIGPAVMRGLTCSDCQQDVTCTGREDARSTFSSFVSRSHYVRPFRCETCDRAFRDRRYAEGAQRRRDNNPNYPPNISRAEPVTTTVLAPVDAKKEFYESWEWRTLRLQVLQEHGRVCKCCGNRPGMFYASGEPVRVVVDHIKPISKYWHLRLDPKNLQPLCDECNMGKGNWDETDFRSPETPDEWVELPQDDVVLSVLDELNGGTIQ